MPSSSFALRTSDEEWDRFCEKRPPPGSNDLMALIKRRVLKAEGELQIFMANLRYFKEASSINFRRSVRYGLGTLGTVGLYWLDRLGIHRSPLFGSKK